jgi:hypothetical protein
MHSIPCSARTMNVGPLEASWRARDAIVEGQTQTLRLMIDSKEVHANTRTHNDTTLLMLSVKQRNAEAFAALADRMRSRSTLSRKDILGNTVLHYIAHGLPDDVFAADSSDPTWCDLITSFFQSYPLHLPWATTNRDQETAFDLAERQGKTHLQALMNMALKLHPYDVRKRPDSTWCDDF